MARKRKAKKKEISPPKRVAEEEIRLLKEGFIPKRTKIGSEFKGKNKIIVVERKRRKKK